MSLNRHQAPSILLVALLTPSAAALQTTEFGPQQLITTEADGANCVHAADLAGDGFIPYRCRQFYPTDPSLKGDRSNHSMTVVLEKADAQATPIELRKSFLQPLGPG